MVNCVDYYAMYFITRKFYEKIYYIVVVVIKNITDIKKLESHHTQE